MIISQICLHVLNLNKNKSDVVSSFMQKNDSVQFLGWATYRIRRIGDEHLGQHGLEDVVELGLNVRSIFHLLGHLVEISARFFLE